MEPIISKTLMFMSCCQGFDALLLLIHVGQVLVRYLLQSCDKLGNYIKWVTEAMYACLLKLSLSLSLRHTHS